MATVINNQKSTYGSPYAFYTLSMTYSDRTATSVKVSYTLTAKLQYAESYLGTGYTLTATIYAGSNSTTKTLLDSSTTWSGTSAHTFTGSFTVTGLSATTTSIPTALYVSSTYDGYSARLNKTSGSNLTISTPTSYTIKYDANGGSGAPSSQIKYQGQALTLSSTVPTRTGYQFLGWSTSSSATTAIYTAGGSYTDNSSATLYAVWKATNGVSVVTLSSNWAALGDSLKVSLAKLASSNKTTVVWSSGSNSRTSHTKSTVSSFTYGLTEARFGSWFGSADTEIIVTVTATTFDSSGTSLGTDSKSFTLELPEQIGKPNTPSATITARDEQQVTLALTRPEFKYNAIFAYWEVTSDTSEITVDGDTVYATIDSQTNMTSYVTIRAIDSRGYRSDPINIPIQVLRKKGNIYIDNQWKSGTPYMYIDNKWQRMTFFIYKDSKWHREYNTQFYSIYYNAPNVVIDPKVKYIEPNGQYSAMVHPIDANRYEITDCQVLMNGEDVSSTGCLLLDEQTLRIYLNNITGNVEIKITTLERDLSTFNVSINGTINEYEASNAAATIEELSTYKNIITAADGYYFRTFTVKMDGTDITNQVCTYEQLKGDSDDKVTISIPSVTGDVVINFTTTAYK